MSALRQFLQYVQSLPPEARVGQESAGPQMGEAPPSASGPRASAAPGPKPKAEKRPPASKPKDEEGSLHLRTALDSKVTINKVGAGYLIALEMAKAGQTVVIGEYEEIAEGPSLRELPIYVEDIVTDDRALVRIKYDPTRVKFTQRASNQPADESHPQALVIQVTTAAAEELRIAAAPKAHKASGGYVAEGTENVTTHSSASEIDKVMDSVASAEGGFASTEGSDAGIFTWGQGQWTVGANLLQPVLEFIKTQRQDLFDRYFGAADLDVKGKTLYWQGKAYKGKKELNELFHASAAQNKYFVDVFSQAGQDPQIQRLQREYQRQETSEKLHESVGGHEPDQWLNTRGKAFYYSMWVNAPTYSSLFFKNAIAAKAAGAKAPTPELIDAVSNTVLSLKQEPFPARS